MTAAFRFGPGRFVSDDAYRETVYGPQPGVSVALTGFELLDRDGSSLAHFACILDAVAALKRHSGPGKVVRCADRVLMKIRHGGPGRRRAR